MTYDQLDIAPERAEIEDLIEERYGLSLSRWMLDIAASLRGQSGCLPIVAADIARSLDIVVVDAEGSGAFGSTSRVADDRIEIRLDRELTAADRNFTIAHELGHVFFMRASDGRLLDGAAVEWACDLFAANLLAPVTYVDEFMRERGARVAVIEEFAGRLNIPERALWTLIAEYYPLSYWWRRVDRLEWIGPFDVSVFDEELREFCGSPAPHMRVRVQQSMAGVGQWVLEGVSDFEGGHGLLMPIGPNVRNLPVVKARNVPRQRLFAEVGGHWELTDAVRTAGPKGDE